MTLIGIDTKIRTEIKKFLELAIPLATAQLTQSLTGFVDTIMMGRFGAETLAGGGLASLNFFAILNISGGLVMGVSPLIAEAYSAGNKSKIEKIATQGFWLVILLTFPISFAIAHIDLIMSQLGQKETTIIVAKTYLHIIVWGFFPALGFVMLRSLVSGLSQARPVMIIVVVGTVFNIFGNYILGFGKFGFPRLELAGLALASTLSLWGMFLALLIYILISPKMRNYRIIPQLHILKPDTMAELIKIGLPIAVFSALEIGLFTIVTYLMGALGTTMLAAHQIVFQTIVIVFMIPLGMSQAVTVRVGHWLGQKNPEGIRRSGYLSIAIGLTFILILAITMLLFPQTIIALYLDINDPGNAEVIALALPMLIIATISQVPDVIQKITYGALQGIQDTRIPMVLSIPAFWGVGLSLGYVLGFPLGWGGAGLWLGHFIGMIIAAILFLVRFRYLVK